MAVLDETNRFRTLARLMRDKANPPGVDKTGLRAALDAADDWVEASSGAFDGALPEPYRSTATAEEKTTLLAYVAMRRAGKLQTEEDA